MSKEANVIASIELASKSGGQITVATIDEPYGKGSDKVVSIGVSLKDSEPNWKVHIPVSNVPAFIEALSKVK